MWTVSCLMPAKEKIRLHWFSEVLYFSLPSSGWKTLFRKWYQISSFQLSNRVNSKLCFFPHLISSLHQLTFKEQIHLKISQNRMVKSHLCHRSHPLCFTYPKINPWEPQFNGFFALKFFASFTCLISPWAVKIIASSPSSVYGTSSFSTIFSSLARICESVSLV